MKQEVVANAAAMGNDINATGHVSVYGIYFDTGKSEIKPESDAAISEIAKLLKNNGALKLYVVGHTDNVGSFDANMKLSKDRADAVVKGPDRQIRDSRGTLETPWGGLPFAGHLQRHRGRKGEEPAGGIGQTVITTNHLV